MQIQRLSAHRRAKCAVKLAVASKDIATSRYKSYTQILTGEDQQYRTDFQNL